MFVTLIQIPERRLEQNFAVSRQRADDWLAKFKEKEYPGGWPVGTEVKMVKEERGLVFHHVERGEKVK